MSVAFSWASRRFEAVIAGIASAAKEVAEPICLVNSSKRFRTLSLFFFLSSPPSECPLTDWQSYWSWFYAASWMLVDLLLLKNAFNHKKVAALDSPYTACGHLELNLNIFQARLCELWIFKVPQNLLSAFSMAWLTLRCEKKKSLVHNDLQDMNKTAQARDCYLCQCPPSPPPQVHGIVLCFYKDMSKWDFPCIYHLFNRGHDWTVCT